MGSTASARRHGAHTARHPIGAAGRDQEEAAVGAATAGDLGAWAHLVLHHQEVIFRTAYLVTRDSEDAETVTRTTFARGYRSLPNLPPDVSLRPWLIGIAMSTARTTRRDRSQHQDAKLPEPDPCPRYRATPLVLDPAFRRPSPLEREALQDAFDGLTDEDRLLLATRYTFRLTRQDGATSLGIGVGQIEDRLRTAMSRLRGRLVEAMADLEIPTAETSRARRAPIHPGHISLVPDDRLGAMTMVAVLSGLTWTPDVTQAVCSLLAREAVAYPEQLSAGAGGRTVASASTSSSLQPVARQARSGGVPMKRAAFVVALALVSMAAVSEIVDRSRATDPVVPGAVASALDVAAPSGTASPPAVAVAPTAAPEVGPAELTGPARGAPAVSIIGAWTLPRGDIGARVAVDWASADLGPIVRSRLERRVGRREWTWVDSAGPDGRLVGRLKRGQRVRFRVRSEDASGMVAMSPVVQADLLVRGPRSTLLTKRTGEWATRRGDTIRSRLVARTPAARLSTAFSGASVAVVGPSGPARVPVAISLDGGPWLLRDVEAWGRSPRRLVFKKSLDDGRHALDLRAEAPEAAIDAVLIVRTSQAA